MKNSKKSPITEPLTQLYLIFAALSISIGANNLVNSYDSLGVVIRFVILFIIVIEWLHSQISVENSRIDSAPSKYWQVIAVEYFADIAAYVMPIFAAYDINKPANFYGYIALIYTLDIIVEFSCLRRSKDVRGFTRERNILSSWIKLDIVGIILIVITMMVRLPTNFSHLLTKDFIILAIVFLNTYTNYKTNRDFYFGVAINSKNKK